MPEFITWDQFVRWLASGGAVLVLVQVAKVAEQVVRAWLKKQTAPGQGIVDRYAILFAPIIAGVLAVIAQVLSTAPPPADYAWVALQAVAIAAWATLMYVAGKAGLQRVGGLGR
jgi:hypothetical protein